VAGCVEHPKVGRALIERQLDAGASVRVGWLLMPGQLAVGTGTANEIAIYNHAGTVDIVVDQFGATTGPPKTGTNQMCSPAPPVDRDVR
jgi:hypothetical protein